jgi:hypothetical protein
LCPGVAHQRIKIYKPTFESCVVTVLPLTMTSRTWATASS